MPRGMLYRYRTRIHSRSQETKMIRAERLRIVWVASVLFAACGARAKHKWSIFTRRSDRGTSGRGEVYVGWRRLGTDSDGRPSMSIAPGKRYAVRLNLQPITASTNYVDNAVESRPPECVFRPAVLDGREQAASPAALTANAGRPYLEIPLKTPAAYVPGDASAGDLDGDGEYELVVHMTGRGRDNAQGRPDRSADPPRLPAGRHAPLVHPPRPEYPRGGSLHAVPRVRPGRRRPRRGRLQNGGRHARWPGDVDRRQRRPTGSTWTGKSSRARSTSPSSPAAAAPPWPPSITSLRGDIGGWGGIGGNGGNDRSGNRVDRFLACVAYLDGRRPSLVMCRGVYGRSVLAAWDFRDGKLTSRWVFDTAAPGTGQDGKPTPTTRGMGGHSVSVATWTATDATRSSTTRWSWMTTAAACSRTGFRHGDALHVSRFDPDHPDPIVFGIHENEGSRWDARRRRPRRSTPGPGRPSGARRRPGRRHVPGRRHRSPSPRRRDVGRPERLANMPGRAARTCPAVGQLRHLVGRRSAPRNPGPHHHLEMGLGQNAA